MLIYDQALDPYHCAVRILALINSAGEMQTDLTVDATRIANYFLVYPQQMLNFTFPAEFLSIRAAAKKMQNPYRHTSGDKITFERMRPIFIAALSGLVAADLADVHALKQGLIKPTERDLPSALANAVRRFRDRQTDVGKFLLSEFLLLQTHGSNGIKHRSGLLEYRYDPV